MMLDIWEPDECCDGMNIFERMEVDVCMWCIYVHTWTRGGRLQGFRVEPSAFRQWSGVLALLSSHDLFS